MHHDQDGTARVAFVADEVAVGAPGREQIGGGQTPNPMRAQDRVDPAESDPGPLVGMGEFGEDGPQPGLVGGGTHG